jgi:ketosteroid isomerase-like protein
MSQENAAVAKAATRRPIVDQIALRMPFLVNFVLARFARLPPGSPLRRRLLPWALQHGFDAVSRNDFDVALLAYEPDAEGFLFGAAGVGFTESFSGHQGWHDSASDLFGNFVETRITVKRALDAGDRWVAELETLGQGKASGLPFATNWGTAYFLSPRGKISRQEIFWAEDGWSQALEAAGLSE